MSEIETTIGKLVDAEPFLRTLLGVKVGTKLRYRLVKLAQLVSVELKNFNTVQEELFAALGTERPARPDEKVAFGQTVWEIAPASRADFQTRLKELRSAPITIPYGPITTTEVEPYPDIEAGVLFGLGPLFDLGVEERKT